LKKEIILILKYIFKSGKRMKQTYYYIEKNGRVFVDRDSEILTLPKTTESLGFNVEVQKPLLENRSAKVLFCTSDIEPRRHPDNWIFKDFILSMDNVNELLRKSIVKTYTRPVVHALIEKDGKILMVKAKRGFTEGFWNLPGGFIEFGENLEEAIKREVKEETGLDVKKMGLFNVYTNLFSGKESQQYYMICVIYRCDVEGHIKIQNKDEIDKINYFTPKEGFEKTKNEFVKMVLNDLCNDI